MPDLKKMLTLEALSEALPSWLKRATKPEYNADEIDSTLTTNQFVTATDKENWNAKGTYSKPSGGIPKSDLSSLVQTSLEKADSALQSETDPTVPSWAKQSSKPSYTQDEVADGTTYKRVTQTEKNTWNGKQNALTTIQMQAVNSGITSEKVTQIDSSLIQIVDDGAKNVLSFNQYTYSLFNWNIRSRTVGGVTFTLNDDGSISLSGTANTGTQTTCIFAEFNAGTEYSVDHFADMVLSGGISEDIYLAIELAQSPYSHLAEDTGNSAVISTGSSNKSYYVFIGVKYGTNTDGITIKPMICTKDEYDISPKHEPHALGNQYLTPAVIQNVDEGAKNVYDFTKSYAFDNCVVNSNGEYTAATGDTKTALNLQATINNGNSVLRHITGSGYVEITANGIYSWIFVMPSGADNLYIGHNGSQRNGRYHQPITGLEAGKTYVLRMNVTQATNASGTFKWKDVMICTLADWKVSQKHVPYCKSNYDLTQYTDGCSLGTVAKSSGSLDNITKNSFEVYSASVTGKPVDNEGNISAFTGLCKTDVYNSSEAMQTLTRLSNGHRWVRTKTAGTWNPWEQLGASCTTYSITPTAINTWTEVTRITIPANCVVKITASIGWDQDPVSGIKLTNETGTILAINEDRSSTNLGALTLTHIENTKEMSSGYTRVLYGEISRITGGGRTRVTVITEYVVC